MPGFELEQVDGGSPIDLPYGETTLGRGPFLGVSDKRVSRNHVILENHNGQLRLKPIHLNPCFIQTSIVASPQPLEKDQWHSLRKGDIFSLMPWKYVYRVHVKEQDETLRNSQTFEEELEMEKRLTEPAEISEKESPTLQAETQSSTLPGHTGEDALNCASHTFFSLKEEPTASKQEESNLPQKKRVLPAWMMTSDSANKSPSSAKGASSSLRGTPTQPKCTTGPKQARATQLSSEEEDEEEETPKRKAKRLESESEDELESLHDATAPRSSRVASVPDIRNQEWESSSVMERDDGRRRGSDRGVNVRQGVLAEGSKVQTEDSSDSQGPSQTKIQGSKVTESESTTSTSKVKKRQRTPCPYGSSCYRKNPFHFQECSHPGDSDYEEEEADDGDDDRPECPYGTHCYRKNLLHQKEYKHTKSPSKSFPDDEDEDHYDSSFINDESEEEEVDEDSDYVPESDDSGKEDIKRLQKEAKAFLARKK
ncbi:aprataxin and PNK-like factor isoform X2 [Myxocyprinus asiaticus]|uniref:aprataxin and PNK-like factor isoform X2 n=1 Tax=Myxocyprinus asiaticus TaxID=70543 RepID=UPI0022237BA1|nr:aprataxin and PNK-like factor isoform X2 [Myxocyprinus asiaticus]